MPDTLKVFSNTVDATATASFSTVPLTVTTTNSTTKAVIKDLHVKVNHPTAEYDGLYDYPVKLKVGGFPIYETSSSAAGIKFEGSQIIDSNSSLTVEIQPETLKTYYGQAEFVVPMSGSMKYFSIDTSDLVSRSMSNIDFLTTATPTTISTSDYNGLSATAIFKNNEWMFVFTNNSPPSQITVRNNTGAIVANITAPVNIGGLAADDTYLYGVHRDSSMQTLYRWSISDFTPSTLALTGGGLPAFRTYNMGFIDTYDGFLFVRNADSTTVAKVNLSSGAVGALSLQVGQSESIGGLITVNRSGVPFIVEHQDTNFVTYNLLNGAQQSPGTAFPTNPTTTTAKQVACIGHGLILVKNGNYSTVGLIDVNSTTHTMTDITSSFDMGGNAAGLMASKPFKTAPAQVSRDIQYSFFASGVEVT